MKTALASVVLMFSFMLPQAVRAQGSIFNYQGRLSDEGKPANGRYDLTFKIWDNVTGGAQIGTTATVAPTSVSNGVFTVLLDFGSTPFNGSARWLEVGVRTNGSSDAYTTLNPRQLFTATPYSIMAGNVPDGSITSAKLAAGSVTASAIAPGAITSTRLAAGTAALNLQQAGQSAVASGGIILAETADAASLTNQGYVKIGTAEVVRERWELRTSAAPSARSEHSAVWTGSEMIIWGGLSDGSGTVLNDGARYNPAVDNWAPMPSASGGSRSHTAVWTGTDMMVFGGYTKPDNSTVAGGAIYSPVDNTWFSYYGVGVYPSPRAGHVAVWTGNEMIIWGGTCCDGLIYNRTNGWRSISNLNAPGNGERLAGVWTGTRMIVWGGTGGGGGIYDPVSNSWSSMNLISAPSFRWDHTAVWSGTEMIVWGGNTFGTDVNDGARYNPVSNRWSNIRLTGAPSPRSHHTAVWTGNEMIIWGGSDTGFLSDGASYNPATNGWTPVLSAGSPSGRSRHTAVWTGTEMIVWGGMSQKTNHMIYEGGRYNPSVPSWTPTACAALPQVINYATAVWSGSEMLVWGGTLGNDGVRYNPVTDRWHSMTTVGAPAARFDHTAVWSGSEMLVWGGTGSVVHNLADGGRYDPVRNQWTAITTDGAPSGRKYHCAVWSGSEMIVWGGQFDGGFPTFFLNDGARYNPSSDSWNSVSDTGAPSARAFPTAVWTGTEMIVWGGETNSSAFPAAFRNDGARYNPSSDSWSPMTLNQAPAGRYLHTAVWTGSEMIVWGGTSATLGGNATYNSGGRYNPSQDTWTPTTLIGAASARYSHTAVWTDREMIVCGGYQTDGGRYDPANDSWTQISPSLPDTPPSRAGELAVWTGNEMILTGATPIQGQTNSTYRYIPPRSLYVYLRP